MAKKYIAVEDAIRAVCDHCEYFKNEKVAEALRLLPAANVVEVVRCKDCLHNRNCEIQYHAQAGDEFYCGAAERRTDEETDIS